jgi:hypothetical protein
MSPDSDRELIETIQRSYRPEPMDAARQAAFRRRLAARLARRPRAPLALPALGAAAAALALWLALPGGTELPSPEEETVFSAFVDPDDATAPSDESLPEDYVVLASLLELESESR